ncbi:MAG: hypothetical protein K9M97_05725 [Akkermansiaceae bacterium]|nr:hypothetical protein [Akkermansiaceae bacterium]
MSLTIRFVLGLTVVLSMQAVGVENLARRAAIRADSEYSVEWAARNVADGQIPDAGSGTDTGMAWAVRGDTHRNGASITFAWEVPATIAHIVYFGRTAYDLKDCWASYEVLVDGGNRPVVEGRLEARHGRQRIALPVPVQAHRLTLRFTASHGGANPGASEIMIFPSVPSDAELTAIMDPSQMPGRLGEALALLRRADKHSIDDVGLDAAAAMLGDPDLFVQGIAEWAIATKVGRDNKDFIVVWPKTPSPAWYRTWNDLPQERRAEMDWVRQAVSLGLHLDGRKLRTSADDLLRRAKALATASGSDGAARHTAEAAQERIQSVIKAMEVPGMTVDDMRALWLKARRALRPAVLASVPATCDQVLFSTVFAPHNTPNVVGTHTSFTYKPGGDLCVLSGLRSGNLKVRPILSGKLGAGHIHGLDLWFDADRVVFAWARQGDWPFPKGCDQPPSMGIWGGAKTAQHELRLTHEPPHLFEVRLDGSGLRQLTDDPYWSDVEPIWLPDGGVAFTSDRCAHGVICDCFCNDLLNLNLYARAPDGVIRRLTNNKDIDRHPALLDNGLIVYTRWEYQERNFYDIHSLWTVRPDGTMADAFFKQHLLRPMGLRDARPVAGSNRQVAIATGHHTYAYGPVVLIDSSAGMNSANAIRTVTPGARELEAPTELTPVTEGGVRDAGGLYQTPCALSDTCFLAPYSYPAPKADGGVESNGFGLYLIDLHGNKELIHRDPVLGVVYPMPLRKRPRPVLPDTTKPSQSWATCVLNDVQAGMGPEVKPGTVKWLRISEALPWPMDVRHGSYKWVWGNAWEANPAQTSWNPVRVIGLVPVEEDGSAHLQVPTVNAASLYFQALDANYCEVRRMRSNVSFQPGETRRCYGCHETQAVASSAPTIGSAAAKPACRPIPPSWGADRALGYEWLVQPVLDRRCMPCHNGTDKRTTCDLTARKVKTTERELNQSYMTLMGGNLYGDGRGNGKDAFVWISNRFSDGSVTKSYEFGSTRSKLIQILKKGHYEVKLDSDEWLRLVTWVDANGIYHDRFIDKRPADGGEPRRDAEFRWPDPFTPTGDKPWIRMDDGAKAVPLPAKGHAFIGSDPRLNKKVVWDLKENYKRHEAEYEVYDDHNRCRPDVWVRKSGGGQAAEGIYSGWAVEHAGVDFCGHVRLPGY